eukprot:2494065-Rhodomonas_salina.1
MKTTVVQKFHVSPGKLSLNSCTQSDCRETKCLLDTELMRHGSSLKTQVCCRQQWHSPSGGS